MPGFNPVQGGVTSVNGNTGAVTGAQAVSGANVVLSGLTVGNGSTGTISLGDASFSKSAGSGWQFGGGITTGQFLFNNGAQFSQPTSGGTVYLGTMSGASDASLSLDNLTASGDTEITDSTKGVILKSPNGTRYRLSVSNAGIVTATAA